LFSWNKTNYSLLYFSITTSIQSDNDSKYVIGIQDAVEIYTG
jgi:hypothetical protein